MNRFERERPEINPAGHRKPGDFEKMQVGADNWEVADTMGPPSVVDPQSRLLIHLLAFLRFPGETPLPSELYMQPAAFSEAELDLPDATVKLGDLLADPTLWPEGIGLITDYVAERWVATALALVGGKIVLLGQTAPFIGIRLVTYKNQSNWFSDTPMVTPLGDEVHSWSEVCLYRGDREHAAGLAKDSLAVILDASEYGKHPALSEGLAGVSFPVVIANEAEFARVVADLETFRERFEQGLDGSNQYTAEAERLLLACLREADFAPDPKAPPWETLVLATVRPFLIGLDKAKWEAKHMT